MEVVPLSLGVVGAAGVAGIPGFILDD